MLNDELLTTHKLDIILALLSWKICATIKLNSSMLCSIDHRHILAFFQCSKRYHLHTTLNFSSRQSDAFLIYPPPSGWKSIAGSIISELPVKESHSFQSAFVYEPSCVVCRQMDSSPTQNSAWTGKYEESRSDHQPVR